MYVHELKQQLDAMPQDAWCEVMFADGTECYQLGRIETIELSQGETRVIIDIVNEVPLQAV